MDALRRWLSALCFNTASHHRGRAFRRREVPVAEPRDIVPEPHDYATPGDRLDAEAVLLAMFALPPWARQVLVLAALEHGGTEIAELLGIPLGTAGSRLRLARARLSARLRRR